MRMSCFLDAAGSFLDVVAPNQQGCRVLHISKHERLAQTSRWPGVAFRSACERCARLRECAGSENEISGSIARAGGTLAPRGLLIQNLAPKKA